MNCTVQEIAFKGRGFSRSGHASVGGFTGVTEGGGGGGREEESALNNILCVA